MEILTPTHVAVNCQYRTITWVLNRCGNSARDRMEGIRRFITSNKTEYNQSIDQLISSQLQGKHYNNR